MSVADVFSISYIPNARGSREERERDAVPGNIFGVEICLPVFGITGTCAGVYSARVEGRHELV